MTVNEKFNTLMLRIFQVILNQTLDILLIREKDYSGQNGLLPFSGKLISFVSVWFGHFTTFQRLRFGMGPTLQ